MPGADAATNSTSECIRAMAKLLASVGFPLPAARVYAYLLIQSEPVGIDTIAAGIGVSRASVWSGVGYLDQVGDVERFGAPGSKRALYAPTAGTANWLARNSKVLSSIGECLHRIASVSASHEGASELKRRANDLLRIHEILELSLGNVQ